ncbi:glycosyltransferase family 4 protein [Oryzicola mucosus]|uniref:Glycosyltransferase family 4 protein n=1 Tax=Oryzicola mucosus TaxID=2767425 RepID=A0A8J6PWR4_9HYPH|nr:glycosyltransferase family 4 protein [Oryzicola mucosus]MBD0415658.1 glycosyltransferase family 4 protein [Oryzicola mucosus]
MNVMPRAVRQPKLMIATRVFGAAGQPWMWRQVVGFQGFRKEIVYWERQNADTQPTPDVREHLIPGKLAPYHNDGRWLYRSRAIFNGSFYAAIGDERMRLRELFRRDRPDVMLCNFGDIAMRLLPTAGEAGIPVVAYFHGDFSFIANRWYRWSLYRCIDDFAAVVVVTHAERDWLIQHGMPADKIHYIPCGAPTDIFQPIPEKPDDLLRFVMVSRLSEEKGCDVSITAFARVAAKHPKARLSIFGDGVERDALKALVDKLGIRGRVTFHGFIDEARLAEQLPKHDVFIQHSRIKEGSPVSIIEAMACGLPVVATRIGGIADQVVPGETGFLLSPGDLDGMATSMQRLASDASLRRSMGGAARNRAVTHHDAATQTQKLGRLLMEVALAEKARPGVPA